MGVRKPPESSLRGRKVPHLRRRGRLSQREEGETPITEAELAELIWQRFGNHIKVIYVTGERGYLGTGSLTRAGPLAEEARLTRIPTPASLAHLVRHPERSQIGQVSP